MDSCQTGDANENTALLKDKEDLFPDPLQTSDERAYYVQADDTLKKIAVHYGYLTGSQLARFNHLFCTDSVLYPGQKLYIPTEEDIKNHAVAPLPAHTDGNRSEADRKKTWMSNPFTWALDSVYSIPIGFSSTQNSPSHSTNTEDDVLEMKFIKMKAQYVDLQSFEENEGVLLVTPDAICFDTQSYHRTPTIESSLDALDLSDEKAEELASMKDSCFTLHIPLETIVSFNTHTELQKLFRKNEQWICDHGIKVKSESFQQENDACKEAADSDQLFFALSSLGSNSESDAAFFIFRIPMEKFPGICQFLLNSRSGKSPAKAPVPREPSSLVGDALAEMAQNAPDIALIGGQSNILTESMLQDLSRNMPAHWYGSDFQAIYNSENDGFSLNTIYRKTRPVESAMILLIKDTMGATFGAIMSERMHCSHHFYGTGETCVFHWNPDFKMYEWTNKNFHIMRGAPDSFQLGVHNGHSAIWFDAELKYGRSEATETFGNPVLCGRSAALNTEEETDSVQFIIDKCEVWAFAS